MSVLSNIRWGRVIAGAALITAVVAAFVFFPGFAPGLAEAATSVGTHIAEFVAQHGKAVTLGVAAAVGAVGATVTGGFADRVHDSASSFGIGKA